MQLPMREREAGLGDRAYDQTAAAALADELRASLEGEVRFDEGGRALYATDASNYRQVPIGVVIPRTTEDIVKTVAACRRYDAPVLPRGGGTSLAGQCCNVAVVIDCSKYLRHVQEIDPDRKLAWVQPGTVLDDLRNAAEQHHLTFAPDPATHNHNTLGGMLGNNSCGVHAVMGGKTVDNTEALDILLYDGTRLNVGKTSDDELAQIIRAGGRRGEIYHKLRSLRDRYADLIRERYPKIPRRVSGYNLDSLLPENGFHVARALVGSEGTCATILNATLNLVHSPPARVLLVLGYPDIYESADDVPRVMSCGPIGLEGVDDRLIQYMRKKGLHPRDLRLLPEGGGWLLAEFGGQDQEEAEQNAHQTMDALKQGKHPPSMKLLVKKEQQARLWEIRESGLGATAWVPGMHDTWPGWEDSAVPPEQLGGYLRDLRGLFNQYDYGCSLYGHFGQGCVHVRIDFELRTAEGIAKYRRFIDDASDLVVQYGGSLSGEHGDGQSRAELLPKMFGPELVQAFEEFKSIWDPDWKMNPGKVVRPNRIVDNLRLGTTYDHRAPEAVFSYHENGFSFAQAALRCVGVGKCRREDGGTMCPSYMVTHEEKHSTRGRARLLFEMLEGNPLTQRWKSESVKEALDLCLACKGCKSDCPVNVDMATYKAEFLSHYYEGRLRPRSAYAFGLIMYWAQVAALAPRLVNVLGRAPLTSNLAKWAAGVAPERQIPQFATETFQSWYGRHGRRSRNSTRGAKTVVLWPDTFNNNFHTGTARAALHVLQSAGFDVRVPQRFLCCGRPFYDYGMLALARRHVRQILDALRGPIRAGVPIVVLEPSCASVFRDEMVNLFPHDEDARRLEKQTYLLSEFLEREAPDFDLPKLDRKAIVQGHCHHKAIMGMDAEDAILQKLGLDHQVLDSGCCGMAGAFGFEQGDHYDVSVKAGERVILPAVRAANRDTLVIADGFSCREQIEQGTDRRALHLAEVLQLALDSDGPLDRSQYPENQALRTNGQGGADTAHMGRLA
ncbi:MAG: FAD-binding and (Fe-S)-binding domain-containing protein, partial [Chloroflexota bacterium]